MKLQLPPRTQAWLTKSRLSKAQYDQFKEHFKDSIYNFQDFALEMDD